MENIIPNNEREERIKKLEEMQKAGIVPYPALSNRNNLIDEVVNDFENLSQSHSSITVCGRLKTIRSHGNLSFAHLEDVSGRIQIAFSKSEIGPESYQRFTKLIDIGDFIQAEGKCFLTHKGEKSIMISSWRILSKAIRPLPDKWHGLSDDDKRQRFRELEMLSNRDVLARFQRRSSVYRSIRELMWKEGFSEIETPILQNVYGGTYAKPFMTHYNVLDFDLYLRIAPEIFLKRAIVGGFEKIFEIGKCFRNEGMGPAHLQEFTMFEFYWPYSNYKELMDFTEKLFSRIIEKVYAGKYQIKFDGKDIDLKPPYDRITFSDLIKKHLGIELSDLDTCEKIETYVRKNNLSNEVHLRDKISWSAQLDELYKKTIRKKIIQPIFVVDYPREFMALAKVDEKDPKIVNTFQLVVNGSELIKAYNELNDPVDQRQRFEAQDRLLLEGDDEAMPYDHDFVESMEYGMPPIAGWGMGLDRFISLLEGEDNLREVIIFPTMKPKERDVGPKQSNANYGGISAGEELGLDNQQAHSLADQYIQSEATKLHSIETEAIMKKLAALFGQDEEKWGIVGLLHDLDWDLTKSDPEQHCLKAAVLLKEAGGTDFLINTVLSHRYGHFSDGPYQKSVRSSLIEFALAASETLTGLIVAAALMQPEKKLSLLTVESLKKKYKNKSFAAKCDRQVIKECEKIGLSIDEFLKIGLDALQRISPRLGL